MNNNYRVPFELQPCPAPDVCHEEYLERKRNKDYTSDFTIITQNLSGNVILGVEALEDPVAQADSAFYADVFKRHLNELRAQYAKEETRMVVWQPKQPPKRLRTTEECSQE
jgi:hypothetical protein